LHLTRKEQRIYDGEQGWAYQVAMKILVKLGDLYGATRLIPIESAHVSGVSYKTIGDAPIEFLEALAQAGAKARVPSTINPAGFDYGHLAEMAITPAAQEKQAKVIELYKRMEITSALTCTPYYISEWRRGSHLAWAESSAAVYTNSLLGSWTNREGGPSALAAALIGKTPDYGLHRQENRQADIQVKVETKVETDVMYGALGLHLGKILEEKVPVIEGLQSPKEPELKQMGAAIATSGMTSIYHLCDTRPKRSEKIETLNVGREELEKAFEGLSTTDEEPDMVFIGCPHCSFSEVKQVADQIRGRRVQDDIKLWVCTSRRVRENAKDHVEVIENAGGKVLSDTCAIVTWVKELGVDTLMTNSAKTAYYAPTLNKVQARLCPLNTCINTALGRHIN